MTAINGTILLIDDDPSILLTLGDALALSGYKVRRSSSAEHALTDVQKERPDLIILDISMPGIGGLGFLKAISDHDGTIKYPVLVFTARAVLADFFAELGVNGFVPKTATPESLLEEVKRITAKRTPPMEEKKRSSAPRKLLLVEDDVASREGLLYFFRQHQHEVWGVSDGFNIAATIQVFQPDVILLKYILPHMNGPAIAQALASAPATQGIPIILYDASGLHSARDEFPCIRAFVASADSAALLKAVLQVHPMPA